LAAVADSLRKMAMCESLSDNQKYLIRTDCPYT